MIFWRILCFAGLFWASLALAQTPGALQLPPKPNVEMLKWIETVDAQWQATFDKEVATPFQEARRKLGQQYLATLDANAAKASGAGDLDQTLVWRSERDRFASEMIVPAADEAGMLAALKQVRDTWRAQWAQLQREEAAKVISVQTRYDQILDQAQTQLTQRGRIDDALQVKNQRAAVVARWITPEIAAASQKPAAPNSSGPSSAPLSATEAPKPPLGTPLTPPLAQVEASGTALAPLAVGAKVWSDRDYTFTAVAKGFEGCQFTQSKCHAGTLTFRVLSDGLVQMVCTSRFLDKKGPGGWESEVMTERMLQQKNWRRQKNVEFKHSDADHVWWLFTRQCKAGEEFAIRTEKYSSPFLVVK